MWLPVDAGLKRIGLLKVAGVGAEVLPDSGAGFFGVGFLGCLDAITCSFHCATLARV